MFEYLVELDTKLFLILNGSHNEFFDSLMHLISSVAVWIPLYLLILAYIFNRMKWQGLIVMLFLVLTIFLVDQGSVVLFKNTFQRLRPCHNPQISALVHLVNNECGGKYGFISSHAANTFALALFSTLFFKNIKFTIFIFSWASIVSYSRIYLGVHYPSDILAGALFGSLIGYLTFQLYSFFEKRFIKKPEKIRF
jgi:undecaprenyl-diphosphatase